MRLPPLSFDPRRGVAHPVWWCALAALALNDHVLKGAAPGWLTGKLSDVAGLVVAPVLAAALVGRRRRAAAFAAFGAVAAAFAAVKTSAWASGAYVAALGLVGVTARNACDPTDLVALAALPLAWRLCRGDVAAAPRRPLRPAVQRLAVALGGVACMATSYDPGPARAVGTWQTRAWVANATREPVELRLRWLSGAVDCATDPSWERVLTRSAFGAEPLTVRLEPRTTFPLDRAAALAAIGGATLDRDPGSSSCDAVLVQGDGVATTVLWWDASLRSAQVEAAYTEALRSRYGGFVLEPGGTSLRLGTTGNIGAPGVYGAPRTRAMPPADESEACEPGPRYLVALDDARWRDGRVLTAVRRLPDGCTHVEAGEARAVLCVPEGALALRVGDAVRVEADAEGWWIRGPRGGAVQVLSAWRDRGLYGVIASGTRCEGRTPCGAWVRRYGLGAGGRPLEPGESAAVDGRRVFFGSAEQATLWPDACGAGGGASPGGVPAIRYNLVIVHGGD